MLEFSEEEKTLSTSSRPLFFEVCKQVSKKREVQWVVGMVEFELNYIVVCTYLIILKVNEFELSQFFFSN